MILLAFFLPVIAPYLPRSFPVARVAVPDLLPVPFSGGYIKAFPILNLCGFQLFPAVRFLSCSFPFVSPLPECFRRLHLRGLSDLIRCAFRFHPVKLSRLHIGAFRFRCSNIQPCAFMAHSVRLWLLLRAFCGLSPLRLFPCGLCNASSVSALPDPLPFRLFRYPFGGVAFPDTPLKCRL